MREKKKIKAGVLGAGSWGTALSVLLHSNGHQVSLWEFDEEQARKLVSTRENPVFLPGVDIPSDVEISSDLEKVATDQDVLVIALPSHVVRMTGEQLAKFSLDETIFVSCSKGIENYTLYRMSEVLQETMPSLGLDRIVVLTGPSHAEEVGRQIPTVLVAASINSNASGMVQDVFMNPVFRVYTSRDVVGAELGGSFKNVIAIAAGISDGVGFGDNTKAAILTRGIVEITRLGIDMGANAETFAGLSGMGDLIVTCTSKHSRNRFVGEQIGRGRPLKDVLDEMAMVAEGVRTTQSTYDLLLRHEVEMPITKEVYRVLFEGKDPQKAVTDLMTRDPKAENVDTYLKINDVY